MSIVELAQPVLDVTKTVIPQATSNTTGLLQGLFKEVMDFLKTDTGKMLLQRMLQGQQQNVAVTGLPANDSMKQYNELHGGSGIQEPNVQNIPKQQIPQQPVDFKQGLINILMTQEGRTNIKGGLQELIGFVGDVKISELIKHIDDMGKLFGDSSSVATQLNSDVNETSDNPIVSPVKEVIKNVS